MNTNINITCKSIVRMTLLLGCFASLVGCATHRPPAQPAAAVRAQQATKTAVAATTKASDAVAHAQTALAQVRTVTQNKAVAQSKVAAQIKSVTQAKTPEATTQAQSTALSTAQSTALDAAIDAAIDTALEEAQQALSSALTQLTLAMDTTTEAHAAAGDAVREAQQLHARIETAETKANTMIVSRDRWRRWTFYASGFCALSLAWICRRPLLAAIGLFTTGLFTTGIFT